MLCKYYSLEDCFNKEEVYSHLDELQEDGKIEFISIDYDIIKIRDTGLNDREIKDLLKFFENNSTVEYPDYEDYWDDYGNFGDYWGDDEEDEDKDEDDDF